MFIQLHKSLYVKDPCKKCIVRACCRYKCEESIDFREAFYPYGNRMPALIMLLICYISFSAIIISVSKWFLK
jgi:hypothetical protein